LPLLIGQGVAGPAAVVADGQEDEDVPDDEEAPDLDGQYKRTRRFTGLQCDCSLGCSLPSPGAHHLNAFAGFEYSGAAAVKDDDKVR
jgi:hypothetical protein